MPATTVMMSQKAKSSADSGMPMKMNTSSTHARPASNTVMLKFSASLAASATNADCSRFASHTMSGPMTPPIGGMMKAPSAEKCAIIAQVRSSAVVLGGGGSETGLAGGSYGFTTTLLLVDEGLSLV